MKKINVSFVTKLGQKIKRVNKKVWIIGGSCLAVALVVGITVALITGRSNQKALEKSMQSLATDFYENFYYVQGSSTDEGRAEFVSAYASTGIKIDLDNLARYAGSKKDADKTSEEILKEFVNSKTDKSCDTKESKAIIYPTGDYGKTDYKLEIKLVCGFDSEEETEE